MELAGRVALVTGGAHRVGAALTRALAQAGMRVAFSYHSASREADELTAELRAVGLHVEAVAADLERPGAPEQLVAGAVAHFGQLDLLVNSAAVMMRTPLGDVTVDEWDAMFSLNLRAPFFLAQAARPWLSRTRGAIVNIADLAGLETWPAYVPHGISKAGVIQMTRSLARVFAPEVRVNAVAPGAVLPPDDWTDDARAHLAATTPLHRLGSPEDVTQAVLYLARADYVTGETIVVDGGRHVRK